MYVPNIEQRKPLFPNKLEIVFTAFITPFSEIVVRTTVLCDEILLLCQQAFDSIAGI